MFIKKASLHNYVNDNTLSVFATDIDGLIQILTDESQNASDWMKLNQIIVNPENFQDMFNSKKGNALPRNLNLQINNTEISPQSSVELPGVTIDNELKFNQHLSRLCESAECQLDGPSRLKSCLTYERKKVLNESFICENFNYCPLVWQFCT